MSYLSRKETLQLFVALALATAARLYNLGAASLWLDEAETIRFASMALSKLWVTPYDPTPPLYYTVIHFLLKIGNSEFLLRLPSVIFGVLSIALVYLATRKISGSLAAFFAALVLSLSFHNIEYSQEARAYALLGLCLSASFLGLIQLCLRWRDSFEDFTVREFLRCGGALYALGLIAALYTHNITVFYWLGVQIFFLAWWAHPFSFSKKCLAIWFAVNLSVLIAWLPWLQASLELIEKGRFTWLTQAPFAKAFATWRSIHGFHTIDFLQPYADLALVLLVFLGIYSLRRNISLAILCLSLLVISALATWAYGIFATPVFMLRTVLWGSLISAVLVGTGASRLPGFIGVGAILLVLAGETKGVYDYFDTNFAENENWRAAAAVFNEQQGPDDILLIREPYGSSPFFYYVDKTSTHWDIYSWNCRKDRAERGKLAETGPLKTVAWVPSNLGPDNPIPIKAGARLWVIESHCHQQDWTKADGLFYPNWLAEKSYGFKGVYLHRLGPSAPR